MVIRKAIGLFRPSVDTDDLPVGLDKVLARLHNAPEDVVSESLEALTVGSQVALLTLGYVIEDEDSTLRLTDSGKALAAKLSRSLGVSYRAISFKEWKSAAG